MRNSQGTIAIVIVVLILVAGAFYFGMNAGGAGTVATSTPVTVPTGTDTDTGTGSTPPADYYQDSSSWQTDKDTAAGFSIQYPIDFDATANTSPSPTEDWRLNSGGNPGNLSFTLTIPKAFKPQTNFDDAKLTVGESGNDKAVADCMTPDPTGGPASTVTTKNINGTVFTIFTSSDAGAGNLYDSTSYRAMHAGKCYAVEYTIHSSQLANYPASYGLTQFDKAKVTDVLDRIAGTFTFI